MPRPRFHRLPVEDREHILDVATAAFAEHGYERTSYNELLTELGLTKGSAYHAFDGKADVYALVVERAVARLAHALPAPADERTTACSLWSGVRTWLEASFQYLAAHPDTALLLADVERSGVHVDIGPLTAPIAALVAHGQRVGCVRTDLDGALLVALTAAVLRPLDHTALTSWTMPADMMLDVMLDAVQRVLRP